VFAGARVSHLQRVEKEEPVQDNFNAGLSANVLRLGQPRSVQATRNSGNASTGQHKSLERGGGQAGYPFCASFAQVSLSVIVRFKTSLPGVLSLSNAK
jgi:hypothetical protein